MANLMQTGIEGLDRLLDGGFLHHNSLLLKGPPGSGKTTLGMQMLVRGATDFSEPGLMVSFEQFPQQLQRDTEGFGWNMRSLRDQNLVRVFFVRPEDVTFPHASRENPLVHQIADAAAEMGARRLLIDSVSHLREIAPTGALTPRQTMLRLLNAIKSLGLTPIMTCEMNEGGPDFEDYLVDGIFITHHVRGREGLPDRREIEIVKTRGQTHIGGRHPLRISERGIEVFPHLLPESAPPAPDPKPVRSGISGLDKMLGGGFTQATTALVAGMAGTFKTTVAAHFLAEGARSGEPGLMVTYLEPPGHLVRFLAQRGVDLEPAIAEGQIAIWHRDPAQGSPEELLWEMCQDIDSRGVKRLVIDTTNQMERGLTDPDRMSSTLNLIQAEMAQRGVTTLMTQRIERVSGRNPTSDIRHVSLVDTIIFLGLAEIESQLEKVISVLKHRGAKSDSDLRALECGSNGLRVAQTFAGLSGVLEGTPLGQRKAQVEEIYQPLYVLRDFLQVARDESLDAAARNEILGNLSTETDRLIRLMIRHFGEPDVDRKE